MSSFLVPRSSFLVPRSPLLAFLSHYPARSVCNGACRVFTVASSSNTLRNIISSIYVQLCLPCSNTVAIVEAYCNSKRAANISQAFSSVRPDFFPSVPRAYHLSEAFAAEHCGTLWTTAEHCGTQQRRRITAPSRRNQLVVHHWDLRKVIALLIQVIIL